MKKLLLSVIAAVVTFPSFAQWTISGTNIYNSNTGNVGVGIVAPLSKLSIVGHGTATLGGHADLGIAYGRTSNSYYGISFFDSLNVRTNRAAFIGFQLKNTGGAGYGDLLFATRNSTNDILPTERMRIDNTGNVGIGTSTPGARLAIYAPATSPGNKQLLITDGTTGGYFSIGEGSTGTTVNLPAVNFRSAAKNGEAGLLVGYLPSTNDIKATNDGVLTFDGRLTGDSTVTVSNLFSWRNNGTPKMIMNKDGYLGIGTTSPYATEHIYGVSNGDILKALVLENHGTSSGSGTAIYMGYQGGTTNPYGIRLVQKGVPSSNHLGSFEIQQHVTTAGDSVASWSTALAVVNSGNVGIGTSSPDQKLTVNGIVHSKEVRVDTSIPVPDYVFEKTYVPVDLASLKVYLELNHHLPEMPSAAEIKKVD